MIVALSLKSKIGTTKKAIEIQHKIFIEELQFSGVISKKIIDFEDHAIPKIKLDVGKRTISLDKELYNELLILDKIEKKANNNFITVTRNNKSFRIYKELDDGLNSRFYIRYNSLKTIENQRVLNTH